MIDVKLLKNRREPEIHSSVRSAAPVLFAGILLVCLGGCSSNKVLLMPTPNLYAWGNFDPFKDIPPSLQNNRVEVLYVTDRVPVDTSPDHVVYGYGRSRSAAF